MSLASINPRQVVPPLIVKNPSMSTPEDVNDGALPPAHVVPVNQVIEADPPLVRTNINAATSPLVATFEAVKVVAPEIVLVK